MTHRRSSYIPPPFDYRLMGLAKMGIRSWFALLSVGWFVLFTFFQHWY
jgi:hypothetical protein